MQKFVFPMRETMPFFVSSLRAVDDWKRLHAKRADAITQAEFEANAKYVKSAFARSLRIEDLLRYLDDTVLDINFMVQLPSIEKCLEKWWRLYAHEKQAVDQDILRAVYYDLAFVLVEAKTETIHKNSVSMILRSSWTKWSSKDPPLSKSEFFRLLFILAHLMTTTDRLGDYVIFFQETMLKIARYYQNKEVRMQQHIRRPRMRLKSSLRGILGGGSSSYNLVAGFERALPATLSGASPNQRLSVQMGRVPTQAEASSLSDDEDQAKDCFVELLERNSRCQHVVVDPLLHERRFQEKFKRPGGKAGSNTTSTNDVLIAQNPVTNKFFPPLLASRLRTSPARTPSAGKHLSQSRSTPALPGNSQDETTAAAGRFRLDSKPSSGEALHRIKDAPAALAKGVARKPPYGGDVAWNDVESDDAVLSSREEELLRRSLSRVTLKERVDRNKASGMDRLRNRGHESPSQSPKPGRDTAKKPIYLAISI